METEVRSGSKVPSRKRKWSEFYLDMNKPMMRLVRRALAVGILTAVSFGIAGYIQLAPEYAVPFLTAILAIVDKALRDHRK